MTVRPYRAPRWLPGPHSQTIYPSLFGRAPRVEYRRERWTTPDEDFIDLDFTPPPQAAERPWLVLFHGLEGSSQSHYARALMAAAGAAGWQGVVPHFRGCSGEPNRAPRAYHSGDSDEIDWILRRLVARAGGAPLFAAGVSLGANALLKWLGERGDEAAGLIRAAVGISAPQDLRAGADALARGFNRLYTRNFLATLKHKSLAKLVIWPGLYEAERVRRARDFHDFDDIVTAPLHGFRDCFDYWARSSCKPWLAAIRTPTLVINARNDPFLPARYLATPGEVSPMVSLDYPRTGGHAGFFENRLADSDAWLARRVLDYFMQHGEAGQPAGSAPQRFAASAAMDTGLSAAPGAAGPNRETIDG